MQTVKYILNTITHIKLIGGSVFTFKKKAVATQGIV